MPLNNLYKRIVALQEFDIVEQTIIIINQNSEFLSELMRRQLATGLDGDGKPVTLSRRGGVFDYYADRTIDEKRRYGVGLGKETEVITNYMSGYFYQYLHVVTEGTKFVFDSDVPYFEKILLRSGPALLDLNKQNLELFVTEILRPQLATRFKLFENGV